MKRKIGNSWGDWGLYMTPLEQKFQGGGGGSNRKNHPWEAYGYFLDSHNVMLLTNGIYPLFLLSVTSKLPCLLYKFELSPGDLGKETIG